MTFLKTLTKDGWTIYVYSLPGDRYMIEYSNDGFGSKERKEYESKDELLKMMSKRIADSELDFWLAEGDGSNKPGNKIVVLSTNI